MHINPDKRIIRTRTNLSGRKRCREVPFLPEWLSSVAGVFIALRPQNPGKGSFHGIGKFVNQVCKLIISRNHVLKLCIHSGSGLCVHHVSPKMLPGDNITTSMRICNGKYYLSGKKSICRCSILVRITFTIISFPRRYIFPRLRPRN
jgi:hypothetical protein